MSLGKDQVKYFAILSLNFYLKKKFVCYMVGTAAKIFEATILESLHCY